MILDVFTSNPSMYSKWISWKISVFSYLIHFYGFSCVQKIYYKNTIKVTFNLILVLITISLSALPQILIIVAFSKCHERNVIILFCINSDKVRPYSRIQWNLFKVFKLKYCFSQIKIIVINLFFYNLLNVVFQSF